MHEASLALNVLEIAALLFAFNAVKADTFVAEASVIIDEIPVSGLFSNYGWR